MGYTFESGSIYDLPDDVVKALGPDCELVEETDELKIMEPKADKMQRPRQKKKIPT